MIKYLYNQFKFNFEYFLSLMIKNVTNYGYGLETYLKKNSLIIL